MTEDRIKAIAEEYVKHTTTQKYVWRFHPDTDLKVAIQAEALQLLKYLSTRYCIIEREKVIKEYNEAAEARYEAVTDSDWRCAAACGSVIGILEDLFGTSMFNQKEE